jgi:hypothetical protein
MSTRSRPSPSSPLLFTLNCLNGIFHIPNLNALAEQFVKAEGKGAMAAFAPSGLSVDAPAHRYHKLVLQEIASGGHERLGDAVLAAQGAYAASGDFAVHEDALDEVPGDGLEGDFGAARPAGLRLARQGPRADVDESVSRRALGRVPEETGNTANLGRVTVRSNERSRPSAVVRCSNSLASRPWMQKFTPEGGVNSVMRMGTARR